MGGRSLGVRERSRVETSVGVATARPPGVWVDDSVEARSPASGHEKPGGANLRARVTSLTDLAQIEVDRRRRQAPTTKPKAARVLGTATLPSGTAFKTIEVSMLKVEKVVCRSAK